MKNKKGQIMIFPTLHKKTKECAKQTPLRHYVEIQLIKLYTIIMFFFN
jgi:hypothetical protein